MTIGTILVCGLISVIASVLVIIIFEELNWKSILCSIIAIVLIFGLGYLYQHNTASGRRELVDQRAEFQNGLERTLIVYTADGHVLKEYNETFDIQGNEAYVKFDWNGKRYIYYNCYVETIADIE